MPSERPPTKCVLCYRTRVAAAAAANYSDNIITTSVWPELYYIYTPHRTHTLFNIQLTPLGGQRQRAHARLSSSYIALSTRTQATRTLVKPRACACDSINCQNKQKRDPCLRRNKTVEHAWTTDNDDGTHALIVCGWPLDSQTQKRRRVH